MPDVHAPTAAAVDLGKPIVPIFARIGSADEALVGAVSFEDRGTIDSQVAAVFRDVASLIEAEAA